jgi:hypothetical protein
MTTDERREHVRDVVRRTLGASPSENTGAWFVEGAYRGVPITFSYWELPARNYNDVHEPPRFGTSVAAQIPGGYPLHLRLEPRTDGRAQAPEAPFFAVLQGKSAPIDIVTRLLDVQTCDDLLALGQFTLRTERVSLVRSLTMEIDLSVPYWVERDDVAGRMIDLVSKLVLSLEDARAAADAAANASTGPYRNPGPDTETLHRRRIAEVETAGGVQRFYKYKRELSWVTWAIIILLGYGLLQLVCWLWS